MTGTNTVEAYSDDFFRTNPEVKLHRRFVAANGE